MATKVDLNTVYAPSEDVVYREIEGESIIVPITAGVGNLEDALFTLNETGKAIWKQLDGKRTLADVVAALRLEFEATEEEIAADIRGFVGELLSRSIVMAKS